MAGGIGSVRQPSVDLAFHVGLCENQNTKILREIVREMFFFIIFQWARNIKN